MFENFLNLWNHREEIRFFVEKHPVLGAFLFVVLQALQVVLAPLPGELTGFLAGFLFGGIYGFVLSMLGLMLGSLVSFYIARFLRKKFFKKYKNSPTYLKVKKVFQKHGLTGMFLLYLFPGFPKDFLNYLLGFMPVSIKGFMVVCFLGRIPGTFALSLQGDVVFGGHPQKITIVTLVFAIVFLIFLLIKKRIENWLEKDPTI
ncbi:TVP38/TMEM64 family protein [Thermodesulfobacterium sp. TA1]|uniref:TVP38/TMEM64 family protein n=1 Tax=Thermodesulfobacterium sp. TA1 TaxID=2234087 RepID=UPI001232A9B4|nr:TVP38/TMEM64 family protein [Thermodesulfobacterium sp. TA1]QER41976.1 TVP38/TMEM64 family protein [Thermodesulfobacterium sp. TA1]